MRHIVSLSALGLLAREDNALGALDVTIRHLGDVVPLSVEDGKCLRRLAGGLRVSTLRELVFHPQVDDYLAARAGRNGAQRIVRALGEWFRDRVGHDGEIATDDAGPSAAAQAETPLPAAPTLPPASAPAPAAWQPPPRAAAALTAWAESHGVADWLSLPINALPAHLRRVVESALGGRAVALTLGDLATSTGGASTLGLAPTSVRMMATLADSALRWLNEIARTAATCAARGRLLDARARPPSESALVALQDQLRAARAALAREIPPRLPGAYLPYPTEVALEPCRITYREGVTLACGSSNQVEIEIEERPPRIVCSSCHENACPHALAALDAALDLLRDPAHPGRQKLADVLAKPPWVRLLRLFDGEVARAPARPPANMRLVWRIDPSGDMVRIEPLLQKLTKAGKWSPGQRIHLADLAQRPELCTHPADRRTFEALHDGSFDPTVWRATERVPIARLAKALDALRGHDRVLFGYERDRLARIERARFRIVLEPSSAGLRIVVGLTPSASESGMYGLDLRVLANMLRDGEDAFAIHVEQALVLVFRADSKVRALVAALVRQPAVFPPDSHDELLRRLNALQESAEVVLPPELLGDPAPAERRLLVRFSLLAGGGAEIHILARPAPGGATFPPGEGPPVALHAKQGRRIYVHRDLGEEKRHAAELRGALPLASAEELGPWALRLGDEEAVLDVFAALRERTASPGDVVVEWPADALTVIGTARVSALRVRISEGRDWFGLDGDVELDGERVPLHALLQAIRQGRRYVALSRRRFAAIDAELRQRLAAVDDVVLPTRRGLEITFAAAPAIADLIDEPGRLEAATRWRTLMERVEAARALDPGVPAGLAATLRPYQVEGFRWLCQLAAWGMGACLADDMGLGKTLQSLAFLLHRASEGPALVVAPTSVGPNWIRETERFAKGLRARLYRGAGREALLGHLRPGDLVVTSYALATRDAEALSKAGFATLVLDEAQAIKNALTRRARAMRSLRVPIVVALTGTPVENHLGELWSVMRLVAPGLLGSFEQFRERFAAPIERHRDPARRAALARSMRPFLLRRTKAQVAPELPPRVEVERFIELSAGERMLYEEARREAIEALAAGAGGPEARFAVLAAITRLRRLACHPRLIDEASTLPSSKLTAFVELARELREEGHRALVFSQFTSHLSLVREALEREGISYEYLDGATPAEQRARRVEAFQAGGADLFLISLKAGGSGLNLTAADYVIHLDPWWNPAVEDQATDRAHRIGQTKPVTVIRLIARATIEEAVIGLHDDKRALAASVFDEKGGAVRLSTEELAALIRAGEGTVAEEDDADDGSLEEEAVEDRPASIQPAHQRRGGKARASATRSA